MAISTNSVIHYTGKIDNLKGILKCHGFQLKYCSEALDVLLDESISSAVPIVSFCDIPLSEVKNHIDSYGKYGIGLNKSWAKKSGLNPVLYLEKESSFSEEFKAQANLIIDYLNENGVPVLNKTMQAYIDFITKLLKYCKNYEGPLNRGKVHSDNYRFYDEKEWRYVANKKEIGTAPHIIHTSLYNRNKSKYNKQLENCYLKFSHKDISYIIVDNENEIPDILNLLHDIYEDICTTKDLKILTTKILTQNQIQNDF